MVLEKSTFVRIFYSIFVSQTHIHTMTLQYYLETINQRFKLGNATEHTFRGDLQHLLEKKDITSIIQQM